MLINHYYNKIHPLPIYKYNFNSKKLNFFLHKIKYIIIKNKKYELIFK